MVNVCSLGHNMVPGALISELNENLILRGRKSFLCGSLKYWDAL